MRPLRSRRAFLGLVAAAVSAAAAACTRAASASGTAPARSPRPVTVRRPVSENALPGDPHWDIRHLGPPDAMLGYAGQASVLPGEPVTIYASTTARSFTVSAFRMGWYRGDLARLVWRSAAVPGHRQRKPVLISPTNTVEAALGTVPHRADARLAGRLLPAAAGRRVGRAAVRPRHRPVRHHRRQDRDQERGRDLAGLQHLGRLRPLPRPRRHHRLQQPLAGGQPGPALRRQRRLHVPVPRAEAHRAG